MSSIESDSLLFYCLFRRIHKVADLSFNWLVMLVCFKYAAINARHFSIWKCLTSVRHLVLACVTYKINPLHLQYVYFSQRYNIFQYMSSKW